MAMPYTWRLGVGVIFSIDFFSYPCNSGRGSPGDESYFPIFFWEAPINWKPRILKKHHRVKIFSLKKSGAPPIGSPESWKKKITTSSNKYPKRKNPWTEAECRHYHRVDAVLRPVVFYQEKYCPSWEGNDTNHFKEPWHQKHAQVLTGFFRRFFFCWNIYKFARSSIPKWAFRWREFVKESNCSLFWSLHPLTSLCMQFLLVICCGIMNMMFFRHELYTHICIYIIGSIIRQHPGNNRQHHQKYMSSFSVFHFVCLSIVHVKPVPSFILERNNIPSKIFIAEGWADQMSRWYVLDVGATSRWKIIEICNGKSWKTSQQLKRQTSLSMAYTLED